MGMDMPKLREVAALRVGDQARRRLMGGHEVGRNQGRKGPMDNVPRDGNREDGMPVLPQWTRGQRRGTALPEQSFELRDNQPGGYRRLPRFPLASDGGR